MKKAVMILLSSILTVSSTCMFIHAEGEGQTDPASGEVIEPGSEEMSYETEELSAIPTETVNEEESSGTDSSESEPAPSESVIPEEQPEESAEYLFGIRGDTEPVISESGEYDFRDLFSYPPAELIESEEEEPQEILEASKDISPEAQIKAEYSAAKSAAARAEKKVSDAREAVNSAEARKAAGIKGFFEWLSANPELSKDVRADAKIAVRILNNDSSVETDSAYIGTRAAGEPQSVSDLLQNATDVNDLTYLRTNVLYIQECNDLRAGDEHFPGLQPLRVSSQLMAMAMLQLNWSANRKGHSMYFSVGENLAWGYPDPFSGWYWAEKTDYENGNYSAAGHYTNICRGNYVASGFATLRQNAMYGVACGQVFESWSCPGALSVSEYLQLVDKYVPKENAAQILEAAEQELAEATARLSAAKAKLDITEGRKDGFVQIEDKYYWYEKGVRQGTASDKKGVTGDGTIRGREVCDFETRAWYWLDAVLDGAKAVNKEVWMPYIFQDEKTMTEEKKEAWRTYANTYTEDPDGTTAEMGNQLVDAINERTGKWVRYDENGKMYKGWLTITEELRQYYPDQVGNTYYYDYATGLMAKGWTRIGGRDYHFDETTGVLYR